MPTIILVHGSGDGDRDRKRELVTETGEFGEWTHYVDDAHPGEPRDSNREGEVWAKTVQANPVPLPPYVNAPPPEPLKNQIFSALARELLDFSQRNRAKINWPDTWDLFSHFLPKKAREDVFEPAQQDMLKQLRKAKRKYKHWAARLIVGLAFTFRFLVLVVDCWRALLTDKAFAILLRGVPEPIKRWWR